MEPVARTRTGEGDRRTLATTTELATYLNLPPQTLKLWRHKGYGPKFLKIGKHVRYRWADVEKWETSELRQATA